jgi:hypothetical protein
MIFLHNLSLFQMNSVPLHSLSKRKLVHTTIGEMVEWSITTVLKTVVPRGTGGSNPSLSAGNVYKSLTHNELRTFLLFR